MKNKYISVALKCLFFVFYTGAILISAGALYYDLSRASSLHAILTLCWIVLASALTFFLRPRRRGVGVVLAGIILILLWHISIRPRQDRDWQAVHARLPHADVKGDIVTIHGIRDFKFSSPTDFKEAYCTKTFNLDNLMGVDLLLNFWGSKYMSHPILSFDFGSDGHICFSIETRREKCEGFSAVGGLYKMFELIYVACTERDCLMLRAVSEGEDVFLYRTKFDKEEARTRFLQFAGRINELYERPEYYNAVTANCTTSIRRQSAPELRRPWDWRLLVNGELDRMLYENGLLDTSVPFDELKGRSHVNKKALEAGYSDDFSEKIRIGRD